MCGSPDIGDRTWDLTALHNALPATPLPSAKPRSSGTTQPELQRCDLDPS